MHKARVLIVDDELEFAATLAERLVLRDYDAVSAGSTEAAMSLISDDWIPDVVLLDLKMPGLSGLDALEVIKKRSPVIEVIMVTGHGSTASGIEGMKRGLFDYLMKPVDIGDIVSRIDEIMRKKII
jgi:DNA-binding NtrC family response regulator